MDQRSTNLTCDIIDNFLDESDLRLIQKTLFDENFPWYYSSCKVPNDISNKYNFQFVHMFYFNYSIQSSFFNVLEPILKKLNAKSLVKIKANFQGCTEKTIEFNQHNDVNFSCKTAVFYINTNNGYTLIAENKIMSIENRMCIFDSQIPHAGTTCTDESARCVINFNYFE